MPRYTKIQWTHSTWNPVTGCDKISAGCEHCYAERMARRLKGMGVTKYRRGFKVSLHPATLKEPLTWKKPRIVFVNSMSDMFHDDVPDSYIRRIFAVMKAAEQHTFQILTKRSKRLKRLAPDLDWAPNIWAGVTVENRDYRYRIKDLRATPASVKFLSVEPLLGPLGAVDFSGIDWVIVGGESGPGARPMKQEWVEQVQERCRQSGSAFFFKQWGGVNKKAAGRLLNGRIWDEMPEPVGYTEQGSLFSS